jgi:biotin carboxyl carrier protein
VSGVGVSMVLPLLTSAAVAGLPSDRFATGSAVNAALRTAVSAAEVAQAALKRDTAAVDYAKFEVSQCVITSPINGIVLHKYRELGDTINYGGQIQAGGCDGHYSTGRYRRHARGSGPQRG